MTKSNINTDIWCGRRGVDPCYFEDKMSEARCGKCYYAHGYEWKPKGIKEVIGFVEGRFPIEREDVLYWLYYAKECKLSRDMEEAQAYGYK